MDVRTVLKGVGMRLVGDGSFSNLGMPGGLGSGGGATGNRWTNGGWAGGRGMVGPVPGWDVGVVEMKVAEG